MPPSESPFDRRRLLLGGGLGLLSAAFGGCAPLTSTPPAATAATAANPPLQPFSTSRIVDGVPEGWAPHSMRRDRLATDYHCVRMDGRQVVRAVADGSSSGLRCDVDVDVARSPWLSWQWRVDSFPAGASIADDDRDDSPARLVLAFDGDVGTLGLRDIMFRDLVELLTGQPLPFAMLMYTWDGEAAPGQVIAYPRTGRIQYLVVESGDAHTGRWLSYRRNVLEDYRRVFGAEPGRLRHVGLLADSDDLRLRTESWFGDIAFAAR